MLSFIALSRKLTEQVYGHRRSLADTGTYWEIEWSCSLTVNGNNVVNIGEGLAM